MDSDAPVGDAEDGDASLRDPPGEKRPADAVSGATEDTVLDTDEDAVSNVGDDTVSETSEDAVSDDSKDAVSDTGNANLRGEPERRRASDLRKVAASDADSASANRDPKSAERDSESAEPDSKSIEEMLLEFDEQKSLIRNRSLLNPNEVVEEERIVGRDEQLTQVTKMLRVAIGDNRPPNLFLYGPSGTGKSLIINAVCENIGRLCDNRGIRFGVVEMNC